MLNSTYFTYNGVLSAKYNLQIASFESSEGTQETNIFSQTINTGKSGRSNNFQISSVGYETIPEATFTVISPVIIDEIRKREIMSWLCQGDDFCKLIINKPEVEDYYYMCKFKDVNEITKNGYCVGFKLTAIFNSPYQYGRETSASLPEGNYDNYEIEIINKSDFEDRYIYPKIEFTLTDGDEIEIINQTDDETRIFKFVKLTKNKPVIIDNELKIIEGDDAFLSNFNKNWLRLKKGKNKLKVTFKGSLKITCPQIVQIYF